MLQWLAKTNGGHTPAMIDGVAPEWLARVRKRLEPLKDGPIGAGFTDDVVSYLLKGEPLKVLSTSAHESVAKCLGIISSFGSIGPDSIGLYEHFEDLPAPVAVRWGKIVAASAASMHGWFRVKMPDGVVWPEALLLNTRGESLNGASGHGRHYGLSADFIESMLESEGLPRSAFWAAALTTPVSSGWNTGRQLQAVCTVRGYPQALARHLEAIRPLLTPSSVDQRLHVTAMLASAEVSTLDALAPQIVELAVGSGKQVRTAAEALVRRGGEAMFDALRIVATEQKPEQRLLALQLIAVLGRDRNQAAWTAFARQTAAADKAPSIKALVAEWDAAVAPAAADTGSLVFTMPSIDWSADANRLPDGFVDALMAEMNLAITKANDQLRQHHANAAAQGRNWKLTQEPLYELAEIRALKDYLGSDAPLPAGPAPIDHHSRGVRHQAVTLLISRIADHDLTPPALMKLLVFFGLVNDGQSELLASATHCFEALHRRTGRPTLLELSLLLEQIGRPSIWLLRPWCHAWGTPFASEWPLDHVWPYFAHHRDVLLRELAKGASPNYGFNRGGLYRALASLPSLPADATHTLFTLALGPSKSERMLAQEALAAVPSRRARIVAALADGKAEIRQIAAQWVGRLRDTEVIPALEAAVATEKQDLAKGAMLDALQAMGQPVEKYLDRAALAVEARKGLAKGLPKDIEWFPWDTMPSVSWADNGQVVPADVTKWLLVQAVKQKSAEPNAVLRKYCGLFDPRQREAFGQFVLETWLAADTAPVDAGVATRQARGQAQSMFNFYKQYPQYTQNDPKREMSVDELFAHYLPGCLRQPIGSAIGSKGVLAVAAACCGERAAPVVQRYLKQWYGTRAAQGKALIAMLAWIEHPSAIQLMLAVGSRFRTRGFQEEATRQAEALADRKGWTLAELADRTVPSAGFDESGEMELSYGERKFVARLLPDFKVELFNPEGKKIAALPEPRQDDDAEAAKESKKGLSAAKKTLKGIVDLQTDRLYEALCTQREWLFADWAAFLQAHPVVRHMVQRLVWVQVDAGRVVRSFRPLDDGTLTDAEDNPVTVADDGRVRIAHDTLLAAAQVAAWQTHLLDYKVKPLFAQLGKGAYLLPPDQAGASELKDFEGHLLEAFALRGRATKLGYTRGSTEDGGWFYSYDKRFPTLGIEVSIEFTGNGLPEENRTVALKSLTFGGTGGDRWNRTRLTLGKVPAVLLSECYHDMRLIAAEGKGFDPDWQKKCDA